MPIDIEKLKERIADLVKEAHELKGIVFADPVRLRLSYEHWYSLANQLIASHLPDRLEDFQIFYSSSRVLVDHYRGMISFLRDGRDRDWAEHFQSDFEQQIGILEAIPDMLDLRALEVAALVTADVIDGELTQAGILLEHGFVRAAGAVAGVALETHLKLLHDQAGLTFEANDTINPLAVRLTKEGFITLGDQKKCTAMADTRNNCTHQRDSEPTSEEVKELIDDVDRFTKRVQIV